MEVCPAHEYRFSGMQRRVAQLIRAQPRTLRRGPAGPGGAPARNRLGHRPAPDLVPRLGIPAGLLAAPGRLRNSQPQGSNNSVVTIKEDYIEVKGAAECSVGVDGRWVYINQGRVNLGVSGPKEMAPVKVMTEAGPSSVVWAKI